VSHCQELISYLKTNNILKLAIQFVPRSKHTPSGL
jgi:hypothetical protein